MKNTTLLFPLFMVSSALMAQQETSAPQANTIRPVSFLLGGGLTFGGETLATAEYTDGSSKSIKAGGIFFFKAGADWKINNRFSLQGSLGYHGDSVNAKNGDMSFERSFMEGIAFMETNKNQRLGLGLRKTSGAKLKSSGEAAGAGNWEFDSSKGLIVEYEWLWRTGPRGFGISLRYVKESYTPTTWNGQPVTGSSIDGSHFGICINGYL